MGKMIGVMPWNEATRLAIEQHLDLVEINPKTDPPIVKLIDYGKFLYREQKAQREKTKAGQGGHETKNIRLSLGMGKHDLDVRRRQVEKFFGEGDRVQIDMNLRGREKAHPELGQKKLDDFLASIAAPFQRDASIRRTNRGFSITIWPTKQESLSLSA